jgi:hypothetical protein
LDITFEPETADQIVHPVQAAKHRALPAARWSDESRDGVFLDRNLGVANGFEASVVKFLDIAIHHDRGVSLSVRWT